MSVALVARGAMPLPSTVGTASPLIAKKTMEAFRVVLPALAWIEMSSRMPKAEAGFICWTLCMSGCAPATAGAFAPACAAACVTACAWNPI